MNFTGIFTRIRNFLKYTTDKFGIPAANAKLCLVWSVIFLTKHSFVFAAGMPNFSVVYFRKFLIPVKIPVKSNSGKIRSKVSGTGKI